MSQWTCPKCGEEVHGIATRLDLELAKNLHEDWSSCEYRHDIQ